MERAYQQGENAAVNIWDRKEYGVWPATILAKVRSDFFCTLTLKKGKGIYA